jgi:murein hydrolase activator
MIIKWRWGILLVFSGIFYSTASVADSQENQLTHLIAQIKNIKNVLQQKHDKRDALQQDLKKIETEYGETSQKRRQTEQQILDHKRQITALEKASATNKNQIQLQRQALAEQLRLAYLLQHEGPVKWLLSQQDLSHADRLLYYYQALNQYRLNSIQQLQTQLEKINHQQRDLYEEYRTLRRLEQQQQHETVNLAAMKNNRTQLMTTINQNISDQNQRLHTLYANKKRLENTLARLSRSIQPVIPGHFSQQNFAQLRGRLPWPTHGVVRHYFNTPIAQSELKWNGEIIEAADEQPVFAVAAGTVVFSKWLEGYGLLLIINHGNGYMTLYGRNHSLYKQEGESVAAGEIIASVGQSGGYDKPALYFGIRYNAKPLDPNEWCT